MDYSESTKVVFQRIEKLDPENVSKIIGYLLLQDHGEHEMIRLAFGPEYILQSLIQKVKRELSLSSKPYISSPVSSRTSTSSNLDPTEFTPVAAPPPNNVIQWINREISNGPCNFPCFPMDYVDQHQLLSLEDQRLGCFNHHPIIPSPSLPEQYLCTDFPAFVKHICHNFRLGYCKYGGSCRFLHVIRMENGRFMVLNPKYADDEAMMSCGGHPVIKSAPLKQLERELVEILKCRRGIPVPFSCLPILYCDLFDRLLNLGEYLPEPYVGGDIVAGITQVLGQMTSNYLRIIDRPRGQLSLILVEDIPKYVRFVEEINNESKFTAANACHVYITFPPHSLFNEQDVHDYFVFFFLCMQHLRAGPRSQDSMPREKDVWICDICLSRDSRLGLDKTEPSLYWWRYVLVKPYRHRPMLLERKIELEKTGNLSRTDPCLPHAESSTSSSKTPCKLPEKLQLEEHLREFEVKRIMETGHASSSSNNPRQTPDDKVNHIKTCTNDEDWVGGLVLPDSPVCM